jgi:hypothetical protein
VFEVSSEAVFVFRRLPVEVLELAGSTSSNESVGLLVSVAAFVVFFVTRRGRVEPDDCA